MPFERNYPETVQEVLDPNLKFKPAALRAVRAFARSKPWRGTMAQRKAKFRRLNRALARAYGMAEPRLTFHNVEADGFSGSSRYRPGLHWIALSGRLSVVTFLHEFAHAR